MRENADQNNSEYRHFLSSVDKVDRASDRQKQYFRKNCLLIHDIDKENQENTDEVVINILRKEMNEEITQDIDRSHRLGNGKSDKNKPRSIII